MPFQMSVGRGALLALFVCGSAACATGRKEPGDADIRADPPRVSTQVITDYTFHVTKGEISLESPGNPTVFDLTEEPDGCLRGNVSRARGLQEVCRLQVLDESPPGLTRWGSATNLVVFTVQLSPDRSRILIDAGASHGEFLLGNGAAADEFRIHPELLGAAFAYGYLPPAKSTDDGAMLDYRYIVSSAN